MCSNLWSHVQNTNAFSYALLWRVVCSSQFYCLTSRYFGALSILTGKADAKGFAVLVFTGNAHFQWIWSDNFWSRDSAPPMAVGEKHRLYNKTFYLCFWKDSWRYFWKCFNDTCGTIQNDVNKTFLKMFCNICPNIFKMFLKRFCVSWAYTRNNLKGVEEIKYTTYP